MRNDDGSLNGIQIARLKDKLGTRQLPTAELELTNARAFLISPPGRGVSLMSYMLNITRLYNRSAWVLLCLASLALLS